jgi:hypothetical protein
MATIIQKNAVNPKIYHGIILKRYGDYFIFGMRINGGYFYPPFRVFYVKNLFYQYFYYPFF